MRMKILCMLAVPVFASACTIGQNAEEWGVARTSAGAAAMIVTSKTTVRGELLEVRSDGVVLLRSDHTLAFAQFTKMNRFELTGLGDDFVVNAKSPASPQRWARFAMLSHFPQGMPPAARDQLLARAGQKEPTVIE